MDRVFVCVRLRACVCVNVVAACMCVRVHQSPEILPSFVLVTEIGRSGEILSAKNDFLNSVSRNNNSDTFTHESFVGPPSPPHPPPPCIVTECGWRHMVA